MNVKKHKGTKDKYIIMDVKKHKGTKNKYIIMDVKKHNGTKEKYIKSVNALYFFEIQYIKTMT
jgi:hypothetical protein